MSRVLDKFTYTTTYKQEFCHKQELPRDITNVEEALVDCKGKFIPGTGMGSTPDPKTLGTCSCQAGGVMPPRGARTRGQPTNLDKTCICFSCGKCVQPPPIKKKIEESRHEAITKKPDNENKKPDFEREYIHEGIYPTGPLFDCSTGYLVDRPEPICPRLKRLRPVTRGKYGGQFEGVLNMPAGREEPRNNGPFWMQEGKDEQREPDILKLKRQPPKGEMRDVIYGRQSGTKTRNDDRIPGPYWIRQKPDEKREVEEKRRRTDGDDWEEGNEEDDQAQPYPFTRGCRCEVPSPQSGPDKWMLEKDWGNLKEGEKDPRTQKGIEIPSDVEETIRQPPAARLSCAPEAEVSNYDQPNAFMKKLYEKYPYLYSVLKETPPEELISKVFKDRFLSTYQVDYLHMGMGKVALPEGGVRKEEKFTGLDGEPEPEIIPGCSYRHSQKGDFGRKKPPEKDKKEKEEAPVEEEKEEPRISEYMATISKLGNDIVQDRLYKVAQLAKNIKNHPK